LPLLEDVRGALLVNGSKELQSECDTLDKLSSGQGAEIQGQYQCVADSAWSYNPSATSTASTTASTTASGTATSVPAAAHETQDGLSYVYEVGIGVGVGGGVLVLAGITAAILWRRRRKSKGSQAEQVASARSEESDWAKPEMSGEGHARSELHGNAMPPELRGREIYEAEAEVPDYSGTGHVYELPGPRDHQELPKDALLMTTAKVP
jgi:hypothetical protein